MADIYVASDSRYEHMVYNRVGRRVQTGADYGECEDRGKV